MKSTKHVIILMLSYLVSFNLSAQQITPNWKTFESAGTPETFEFSFRYPDNWITDTCNKSTFIVKLNPKYINNVSLLLKTAPFTENYTNKEISEDQINKFIKTKLKPIAQKCKILENRNITIDNQSYLVVDYQYEIKDNDDKVESYLARTYFFRHNNNLIYFKSEISIDGTLSETTTNLNSMMGSYSSFFESIIKSCVIK